MMTDAVNRHQRRQSLKPLVVLEVDRILDFARCEILIDFDFELLADLQGRSY